MRHGDSTYRMTDFHLSTIAPGIIDHKEWTPDNGHNNALRINGLGAPRAFFTPLLREIGVPNVSYGEDYALGLAFSRTYKIGRIYDELYLCRRGRATRMPHSALSKSTPTTITKTASAHTKSISAGAITNSTTNTTVIKAKHKTSIL